jgi:hypothetical protein
MTFCYVYDVFDDNNSYNSFNLDTINTKFNLQVQL